MPGFDEEHFRCSNCGTFYSEALAKNSKNKCNDHSLVHGVCKGVIVKIEKGQHPDSILVKDAIPYCTFKEDGQTSIRGPRKE